MGGVGTAPGERRSEDTPVGEEQTCATAAPVEHAARRATDDIADASAVNGQHADEQLKLPIGG